MYKITSSTIQQMSLTKATFVESDSNKLSVSSVFKPNPFYRNFNNDRATIFAGLFRASDSRLWVTEAKKSLYSLIERKTDGEHNHKCCCTGTTSSSRALYRRRKLLQHPGLCAWINCCSTSCFCACWRCYNPVFLKRHICVREQHRVNNIVPWLCQD